MGFWIFMLIMVLLIPLTMIFFGWLLFRKTPKEINYVYGYRTKRSMMNEETWRFANQYFGKAWCFCGLILAPLSVMRKHGDLQINILGKHGIFREDKQN